LSEWFLRGLKAALPDPRVAHHLAQAAGPGDDVAASLLKEAVSSRIGTRGRSPKGCEQRRQVLPHGLPEDLHVDSKVLMRDLVPHPTDVGPGNLWRQRGTHVLKRVGRLTDDDDRLAEGIDRSWVGGELLEGEPVDVLAGALRGRDHVAEPDLPFSRRHARPRRRSGHGILGGSFRA
jgi:hypothetical protein